MLSHKINKQTTNKADHASCWREVPETASSESFAASSGCFRFDIAVAQSSLDDRRVILLWSVHIQFWQKYHNSTVNFTPELSAGLVVLKNIEF